MGFFKKDIKEADVKKPMEFLIISTAKRIGYIKRVLTEEGYKYHDYKEIWAFGPVEAIKVEVVDVIDAMTISKELGIDCSDITIMVNEVEDPFKGD